MNSPTCFDVKLPS